MSSNSISKMLLQTLQSSLLMKSLKPAMTFWPMTPPKKMSL